MRFVVQLCCPINATEQTIAVVVFLAGALEIVVVEREDLVDAIVAVENGMGNIDGRSCPWITVEWRALRATAGECCPWIRVEWQVLRATVKGSWPRIRVESSALGAGAGESWPWITVEWRLLRATAGESCPWIRVEWRALSSKKQRQVVFR